MAEEKKTIDLDAWKEKIKKKKTIKLAEKFGETLYDMDEAWSVYEEIVDLLHKRIRPVVDFSGVSKIHSYWLLIAIGQFATIWKDKTNDVVGVVGLNSKTLALLNIVAHEAMTNGKEVLNGIRDSRVQSEMN